jgi:hypothetical protein
VHIRPIAFGVGFPDNEKAVLFELPELVRRQGELGIIAVRFANLPKQLACLRGQSSPESREKGQARECAAPLMDYLRGIHRPPDVTRQPRHVSPRLSVSRGPSGCFAKIVKA